MKITIATGNYAHTLPLGNARLEAGDQRFDVDWRSDRPESIFRQALSEDAPFDVAEMSLATAWTLPDRGVTDFVALPVFPSRMFRLSGFYVRDGIARPEDLAGGRIGLVRYGQTAAVWSRALLAHEFGIDLAAIDWWVAERQVFEPAGARIREAGGMDVLQAMLTEGSLDCLIATSMPAVFSQGLVRRLFDDWPRRERALYAGPASVPIMHTLVMKRTLAESWPGLAHAVVRGFEAAKRAAVDWIRDTDASSLPVPLQHGWIEEMLDGGGADGLPYRLEPNRKVLDDFAVHMFEQGLTRRRIAPDELFVDI
ncbi:MAG: hypothetical protein R3174_11690 [Gammaproteobacteria bacterium]|nr:hypothetical protein [Gammaproteobacteria bacterium]